MSTQENEFGAEIWWRWSPSRLVALQERNFKNTYFYVVWKSTKRASFCLHFETYYFGGVFGE